MTGPAIGSERQAAPGSLRQHYERPPIQEAVVELSVELPEASRSEELLRRLEVPLDSPRFGAAQACAPDDGGGHGFLGFEFRSEDSREIVRATTAGFSYRKVPPPYLGWEEWSPRAFRAMDAYLTLTRPTDITGVAVRYVNRLELPEPVDLENYLLVYPEIPQGLPQAVAGFFMQTVLPHAQRGVYIILRLAQVPPHAEGHANIILDIEVRKVLQGTASMAELPIAALVDSLNRLHEIGVDAFELCITNRTRELFR